MIEGLVMLAAIARGVATADRNVDQGLVDLRASAAAAPEWKHGGTGPGGGTRWVAERQVLAGALAYLEASRAASHVEL